MTPDVRYSGFLIYASTGWPGKFCCQTEDEGRERAGVSQAMWLVANTAGLCVSPNPRGVPDDRGETRFESVEHAQKAVDAFWASFGPPEDW